MGSRRRAGLRLLCAAALLALFAPLLFPAARGEEAAGLQKAIFAGGCFWCMQPPFDHAKGVVSTVVGYAGGQEENPTYEQVSAGKTGHRESIEVTFDPAKISYSQLLDIFWRNINPTQADGQFHDIGHQYTTAIFYTDDAQKKLAEESKEALAKSGRFKAPIATAILAAGKFWPAEKYHQKYYLNYPAEYEAYHTGSGRPAYLERTWGK